MIARLATALVLVAACSRAPTREPTGDREHPVGNRGATVATDAAPPPPDAVSACVTACVQSRQMEAVSIEYIRTSCASRCSQPPPAP